MMPGIKGDTDINAFAGSKKAVAGLAEEIRPVRRSVLSDRPEVRLHRLRLYSLTARYAAHSGDREPECTTSTSVEEPVHMTSRLHRERCIRQPSPEEDLLPVVRQLLARKCAGILSLVADFGAKT
jgi:hypothetical protein